MRLLLVVGVSGNECPFSGLNQFNPLVPLWGLTTLPPSVDRWDMYSEIVPEWVFPESVIHLSPKPLAVNSRAVLYNIMEHADWVIKYNFHCSARDTMPDGSLPEAFFLDYVSLRVPEITNSLLYASEALVPKSLSKVKSPRLYKLDCSASFGGGVASVRFLIVERVGTDLRAYIEQRGMIDFIEAIELGIEIYELIQKLHSTGVVHGDIHAGNLAFRQGEISSKRELVIIDFGESRFRPAEDPPRSTNETIVCRASISPWQSVGKSYRSTLRDDAFNVAGLMGYMMYGREYIAAQKAICGGRYKPELLQKYMNFKMKENLFDTKLFVIKSSGVEHVYDFHLSRILPRSLSHRATQVSNVLAKVLEHLRGLAFEDRPDYEYIVSLLRGILSFHGVESTTSN